MTYFIDRNQQSFGPYTVPQLQTYVTAGSIYPSDIARDAQTGVTATVASLLAIASAPPPSAIPMPPANFPHVQPQAYPYVQSPGAIPLPPNLHWAIVLLINFVFSPFSVGWMVYQMIWVRNIDKQSKALLYQGLAFASLFLLCIAGGVVLATSADTNNPNPVGFVFFAFGLMAFTVLAILSFFDVRRSMLAYYNTVEPIGLRLSGVMTFFFNIYYFQYHMSRIATWKQTGYLPPQG